MKKRYWRTWKIVLEEGEIVETGTQTDLTKKKGKYFNLVKNQLELGV
jgi:ATP-binding cassette subfamily B protein